MGEKVTITRGESAEQKEGRRWLWYFWSCSCGASLKYLNETARKLGSERHADTHRTKKGGNK